LSKATAHTAGTGTLPHPEHMGKPQGMVILHCSGSTGKKKTIRQEKCQEEEVQSQEDPFPITRRTSTRQ